MLAPQSLPYTVLPHLPPERLQRLLREAETVRQGYRHGYQPDAAAQALLAQHGGNVPAAIVAKVGSHLFCKRRPVTGLAAYQAYVAQQFLAQQPLHFRVGFGPLKNMQRYGACQRADSAEYLTFAQLARVAQAVQTIYPHGLSMTVVPDNLRAEYANNISPDCVADYIDSLQQMVQRLGFGDWLEVADGQKDIYDRYNVRSFFAQAEQELLAAQQADPIAFNAMFAAACGHAAKNVAGCHTCSAADAEGAAWRYLVAHEAEVLAGVWGTADAFPLRYGRRAGFFQIFTMYKEETAMPWQVLLPLPEEALRAA